MRNLLLVMGINSLTRLDVISFIKNIVSELRFAASDGNKLSNSARREFSSLKYCESRFAASDGNKLSNSARREFLLIEKVFAASDGNKLSNSARRECNFLIIY